MLLIVPTNSTRSMYAQQWIGGVLDHMYTSHYYLSVYCYKVELVLYA